ncbi:SLC13 family permease [Streptomyces sp. NPDC048255]|uniref:SLC13 family permease n=1 Tax=Streptomyces sp. NPDC048255 TaxID=3154713 RepID=UPI00340843B7
MSGWQSWAAIAVFAGVYVLIITEWIHRVAAALGGAALMLAIGATDDVSAFHSDETGIDWNVIFLLLGMMMIVGVLKRTGLFEYLAIWSVKKARARPFRVMAMLVVITAVASALLDNVTTVLLVAPVTLLVCDRMKLSPIPFLLAEVFASNIGGTATLVGDPPNIIIASRAGLTFNDFLVHLAPLAAVLTGVLVLIPYVATMAPVTSELVTDMGGDPDHVMWWALALGADLGGNATAIGASANVVVLGIAERNRHPITFWQFTQYGLILTAVTVAVSALYLWLRYFALA